MLGLRKRKFSGIGVEEMGNLSNWHATNVLSTNRLGYLSYGDEPNVFMKPGKKYYFLTLATT